MPEALIAALDELDRRVTRRPAHDPAFSAELDRLLRTYTGRPSPSPRRSGSPSTPAARGCCSSARTSTTPARTRSTTCSARRCSTQRMGKTAGHRRDRRGPARRRHRDRRARCSAWSASSTWARRTPAGRRSTSPGCGCSAPRSCRSPPGQPHAQGRDQRGDARLGDQRRHDALPARHASPGPHPFPMMVRDFQRVIGDEARAQVLDADRPAARRRRGLRRRRLQRDRHLPRLPRRPVASRLFGFEAGGDGVETGRHAATHHRRVAGRAARLALLRAAGRGRARRSSRTRSRPASTTPASGPSTPGCTTPAARRTGR